MFSDKLMCCIAIKHCIEGKGVLIGPPNPLFNDNYNQNKGERMFCKDCVFYSEEGGSYDGNSSCGNSKLAEDTGQKLDGDELIYPYSEGGVFSPQPNFGCIHFNVK